MLCIGKDQSGNTSRCECIAPEGRNAFASTLKKVRMPLEHPQSIRTIFFDAGFTLLKPNPSTAEICQRVCQRLNLHLHLDQLKERMTDAEDYYYRQTRLHRQTWASEQAREFDKHTSWQVYPDVFPTLEALRAHGGYTLGVISDWGISLGPILRRLHLTGYFDCLLVSAVTRHAKPSPLLYELALQRANTIADYTLHIGDSYIHDILGARTVGMTPVLLDRLGRLEEKNVDCLLVHSLTDLLNLLEVG